jgi:hypothetical protein
MAAVRWCSNDKSLSRHIEAKGGESLFREGTKLQQAAKQIKKAVESRTSYTGTDVAFD